MSISGPCLSLASRLCLCLSHSLFTKSISSSATRESLFVCVSVSVPHCLLRVPLRSLMHVKAVEVCHANEHTNDEGSVIEHGFLTDPSSTEKRVPLIRCDASYRLRRTHHRSALLRAPHRTTLVHLKKFAHRRRTAQACALLSTS